MNYCKENYITARGTAKEWKNHANVNILRSYSSFITGDVLDVGCNHGATTYWLSELENINSIVGVDINKNSLRFAKQIFKDVVVKNEFIEMDFVKSHIEFRTFDTVISFHTLEHIFPNDVGGFLSNINHNLKPGGNFIISIPYDKAYSDKCHTCHYKEEDLIKLMTRMGFKTIECFKDNRWKEKNLLTGLFKK